MARLVGHNVDKDNVVYVNLDQIRDHAEVEVASRAAQAENQHAKAQKGRSAAARSDEFRIA